MSEILYTYLDADRTGFFEDGLNLLNTTRSQWVRIKTAIKPQTPAAKYRICWRFVRVLSVKSMANRAEGKSRVNGMVL